MRLYMNVYIVRRGYRYVHVCLIILIRNNYHYYNAVLCRVVSFLNFNLPNAN